MSDSDPYPRPGDRPWLAPEQPITYTNQGFDPRYERYPDFEIRNLDFRPRWLRRRPPRFFASPDQILYSLLASDEVIVYGQSPSFSAYLVEQVAPVLLLVMFLGLFVSTQLFGAALVIYGITLITVGVAWMLLALRWMFRDRYTRYVLTTMRVMRVRGFLTRDNAWIPLAKVTDVRYRTTLVGRILGFAQIRIDSANEESGLRDLRNLAEPETFYEKLLWLVEKKQGNINIDLAAGAGTPAVVEGDPERWAPPAAVSAVLDQPAGADPVND